MLKIGFIGAGNMGGAIINGILSRYGANAEIHAFDSVSEKISSLAEKGVISEKSAADVVKTCKYVLLAIKPQTFDDVIPQLKNAVTEDNVIISIAAGIGEDYLRPALIPELKAVIVMPNTPFLLGEGATALAKGKYVTDEEFAEVVKIFETGGKCAEIPMDKMKEIIAVNGSSPAFIYLYAKAFINYAKNEGIDADAAKELFAQSLVGSAKMITDSGYTIDELIKMVSSPGGTTLAGLEELYKGGLTDTAEAACKACTKRAYELSK